MNWGTLNPSDNKKAFALARALHWLGASVPRLPVPRTLRGTTEWRRGGTHQFLKVANRASTAYSMKVLLKLSGQRCIIFWNNINNNEVRATIIGR